MPDLTVDSDALHSRTGVELHQPTLHDGAAMWRMARDTAVLDLNSSYSYLLWGRDFARTSVIAREGETPCGFVTGYLRPDQSRTLMVWQVAVAETHRGLGLARRMLDHLVDRVGEEIQRVDHLETTITADNAASIALFTAFARGQNAELSTEPLFEAPDFPDGHDEELLFRIGPLGS